MLIILSASAYYLSTEYWILSWIAPLLLCFYVLKVSLFTTFCTGLFSHFIGASNPHAVLPIVVYWPLIAINAIAFASILTAFRHFAIRRKSWVASLVFASGWTAYEFIASLYSPHGAVDSIAYTQISNLLIIQIASITGIWGITFILSFIPASIALAWHTSQNLRLVIRTSIIPLSLFLLTITFGFYRLNMPIEGPNIRVGIAAISTSLEQYLIVAAKRDEHQVADTVQRYIQKIDALAKSGAEVVLLPEKIITIDEPDDILHDFSNIAYKDKVTLILGVARKDDGRLYNSAYAFAPAGEELLKYDKHHLVPTFESRFTPGNELGIIGKWGVAICKDMDFSQPSLEYSNQGINIIFVPALDFHDDGWSHARVAIMQGVEGDYAVARAGQWGLLTLSDSRGRIIDQVSTDVEDGGVLIGDIKVGQGNSLYSKFGNWFGWICLGTFIILVAFLSIHKQSDDIDLVEYSNSC
jgi:apolipoprotein N-acyltransferase